MQTNKVNKTVKLKSQYSEWEGSVNAEQGLNVRSSTVKTNNILYVIQLGTKVTVFEEDENWYHVHVKGKKDGWVSKEYITKT